MTPIEKAAAALERMINRAEATLQLKDEQAKKSHDWVVAQEVYSSSEIVELKPLLAALRASLR